MQWFNYDIRVDERLLFTTLTRCVGTESVMVEVGRHLATRDQIRLVAFKTRLALAQHPFHNNPVETHVQFASLGTEYHPGWVHAKYASAIQLPNLEGFLQQAHRDGNYDLFPKSPLQLAELGDLTAAARFLFKNYGALEVYPIEWRLIVAITMAPLPAKDIAANGHSVSQPYVFAKNIQASGTFQTAEGVTNNRVGTRNSEVVNFDLLCSRMAPGPLCHMVRDKCILNVSTNALRIETYPQLATFP